MRPARLGPEIRLREQGAGYKILIMTVLLVICCTLTYYFHAVLEIGTVFTHFFYVPIILAALWWRRKGLVVAVFLAVLLISSHVFVRAEVATANDYLRAILFMAIAFVVATLSEVIAKAQDKAAHLNAVLRAIRNVNQLIIREDDRDHMIGGGCEHLIETKGYHSAWVALVDEDRRFVTAAEAGLGARFAPVVEMMKRGEFTRCGERVLEQPGVVVTDDVAAECDDCPLADACSRMVCMTTRLESGGRVYGILSVSIPTKVASDADEQSLLSEVADDIAFGLQRIELEEGRRQAEEALRESEGRYRSVFENTGTATVIIEENATISMTNTEFDKLCGYSKEDVEGKKSWTEFVVEEDLERMKKYHANRRIKGGKPPTEYEFRFVDKEGNIKNILLKIGMLPGAKRSVASLMDITTHKRAEGCIEHLNSVLKAIRNVNQLIVTEKDRNSLLKNACNILIEARGYEAAWLGYLSDDETFDRVVGSGFREDVDRFSESLMGGDHLPCIEKTLAGKEMVVIMDLSRDCGNCPFKDAGAGKETAVIRIEREGKLFGLLAISLAADVTFDDEEEGLLLEVASDIALALHNMDVEEAHKKAEDQIKASLKEKEVLLREIHHRVKNNLQVVSSLLDMQARDASNKDTIDALTESKDRINAMALIHTQLYEGSDLSEINMNRFVNSLLVQVFQSYSARDAEITPIVSVADYPFPISMAVPVGLLLNELLSNALKHAFVGRKEGTIEVSMTASEEGKINLTVSDDGAGLPPGFDINTTGTLGLRMVKILIEDQLRGSLEVISKEGATFNIEFDTKY